MISTLCLVKPTIAFIENPNIDLPVRINGTHYKYEYGFGYELKDLEKVRVKNDWKIVRCWK